MRTTDTPPDISYRRVGSPLLIEPTLRGIAVLPRAQHCVGSIIRALREPEFKNAQSVEVSYRVHTNKDPLKSYSWDKVAVFTYNGPGDPSFTEATT